MARRVRRSSGPLDLRSQAILRAVIEEYVTTASRWAAMRSSSAIGSACPARPSAPSSPSSRRPAC